MGRMQSFLLLLQFPYYEQVRPHGPKLMLGQVVIFPTRICPRHQQQYGRESAPALAAQSYNVRWVNTEMLENRQ